jgi:hypothetical protein
MLNLAGQRFGMLTVIGRVRLSENTTGWRCLCDCGKEWVGFTQNLRSNNTKSCGCRQRRIIHGHAKGARKTGKISPTYSSWKSMRDRCYHKSNPSYPRYGGAGITVCDRWNFGENGRSAFLCFLDDMGERPSIDLTLDRYPDQKGNYEPGNCRWATWEKQANNRSSNRKFEYQGRTLTFAEIVRETGMDKELLRHRLLRAGWTLEEALAAPKQQGRRTTGERPRLS